MKKIVAIIYVSYSITAFSQDYSYKIDSLFQELKQTQNPVKQFKLLAYIFNFYEYLGQLDSSRLVTEQLFQIAKDQHSDSLLAWAYTRLGRYFSAMGDIKQSLEYKFKALTLFEKEKDIWGIAHDNQQIAVDFKKLRNYTEALKYLRKVEPFLQKSSNPNDANRQYSHMAETFVGLGQPDSALRYIQLANEVTQKDGDPYGFARVLFIFASVYKQKGEADLAEIYYKKCIAYSDSEQVAWPFVNATTDYGHYLLKNGQYNLAKQYGLAGLKMARQSGNKLGIIEAATLLRTAYNTLNLKDSAYYYSEIKDTYRDSLFNEQQINQIQNISFARQISEKEEEARLSEQAEKRKHNLQYAAIAVGLITFLILFLALSRSIIVKTKFIEFFGILGLLAVFEFINLYIHPYLVDITNDSPLLMLLILIGIGAMLIPLHHWLEKWITKKMVEKNKKIRLAAAKKTIAALEDPN